MSEHDTRRRERFDALVQDVRPELLRYCARISGSVVDGEDIVQDALVKAYAALSTADDVANLRAWLFRIAHNQAIDSLRRAGRWREEPFEDGMRTDPSAPDTPLEAREMATMALALFLQLTPLQRGCVFLKDVMGHSLEEIGTIHDASVQAVKAALHRGRARLRELAGSTVPADSPAMDSAQAEHLRAYVERFNARDFDAVRAMLADDVRLDLVGRVRKRGAEVREYVNNYSRVSDWRFAAGQVEGRPAVLVYPADAPSRRPAYFILLEWSGDRVLSIRDYRYARHVMDDADIALPD